VTIRPDARYHLRMPKAKHKDTPAKQSARFREAAKKAEMGDAKEFERAFKKVVPQQKAKKKAQ
jgi:hypothetical protein